MTVGSARRFRWRGRIESDPIRLDEAAARKIRNVLRLGPGATVAVIDDEGREVICRIVAADGASVTVEPVPAENPPVATAGAALCPVTLAIAVIKNERMDDAIEKASEFGLRAIQPFIADRSSRRTVSAERLGRWRRIVAAATLQSGGRFETEILPPVDGIKAVLDANPKASAWHFHPEGISITSLLSARPKDCQAPDLILIGAEGGWSDEEIALFTERGVKAVSLGERILRTETATTIAAFSAFQFHNLAE